MKRIIAEGIPYWYFGKNDDLSVLEGLDLRGWRIDTFMRAHLPLLSNVRVVLIQYTLRDTWFDLYYLFWGDNSDLDELDRKVQAERYSDDDFFFSVMTYHLQLTCPRCSHQWDTLTHGPVECYFRAQAVGRDKGFMYPSKHCPVCRSGLRASVVHIFEE